jgi:hypothetical protein
VLWELDAELAGVAASSVVDSGGELDENQNWRSLTRITIKASSRMANAINMRRRCLSSRPGAAESALAGTLVSFDTMNVASQRLQAAG